MNRETHNGPTDETQARGTPYSGDPQGGASAPAPQLEKLPLDGWHRDHGGRMVPFAGYEMPVQYEGIIAEHLWTRENAGLFDVSHMGQLFIHGRGADVALERLMPSDFRSAADMKPKYSLRARAADARRLPLRRGHEAQIFASARRRRRNRR